ncbi:MAG: YdcF family protein, partial [Alphaproteobacteria bacterium]
MSLNRFLRYLTVAIGSFVGLWALGLLLFVMKIQHYVEPTIDEELTPTEAIVVLTGGSERLATGIELLKHERAKKLFISGVHPKLTLDGLLASQSVPKNLRNCCIILGHDAETTLGNADESMTWMALEKYHSLRLVTSNYHMPRSLLLFRSAMPHMKILPHPVSPDSVKLNDWWTRPGTASLLVTEYSKYIWAILRSWTG